MDLFFEQFVYNSNYFVCVYFIFDTLICLPDVHIFIDFCLVMYAIMYIISYPCTLIIFYNEEYIYRKNMYGKCVYVPRIYIWKKGRI